MLASIIENLVYTIDFLRTWGQIPEDSILWNCHIHGNRICGN